MPRIRRICPTLSANRSRRRRRASLVFGRVTPETPLILESRMAEVGVSFGGGIKKDLLEFNSGTQAVIGIADRKGVLVE